MLINGDIMTRPIRNDYTNLAIEISLTGKVEHMNIRNPGSAHDLLAKLY